MVVAIGREGGLGDIYCFVVHTLGSISKMMDRLFAWICAPTYAQ
jgi:hypothetical protein